MNTPINNDWSSFVPPSDLQSSGSTDVDDCVEESLCHIVYCLTGFRPSPRMLGFQVQPSPVNGSDTSTALFYVNKDGLTPFQTWPTPSSFTWASYYIQPPADVVATTIPTVISEIPFDLSVSPGWTRLLFPNGAAHFVCQINETQYFDSEPGNPIKPLNFEGAVVTSQHGIQVSDSFFPKSAGFTPEQFANLSPEIQNAVKENDSGAKNMIINGQVIHQQ